MNYCRDKMKYFPYKDKEKVDPDNIIYYTPRFDEYGIIIHDQGKSYIVISYCPWCGRKLPASKRDRWFDELEKMGIDDPFDADIPQEYNTDKWWKTVK